MRNRGTLFVLMSALLYSVGGLCIKVIPWHGLAINSGRNIVALLVVGGYLAATRHRPRVNRWVFLGALCVSGTATLFTLANKLTTAANAIVLQFTTPVFVMLISAIFLRKRPKKLDVAVCAVMMAGVCLCFLDTLGVGEMLGNFLALCSGLTNAGIFLLNEMPDSDPISSVFWGDVISVAIGLPFLVQETVFAPLTLTSLVLMGAFQVGVAYICLTVGLKTTPPVTACLISGIEPVLSPIWVAVFYHELIGPLALVGAAMVILSVTAHQALPLLRARSAGGDRS